MKELMQKHTDSLMKRFVLTAAIFALIASALVGLVRYEQSLQRLAAAVKKIFTKVETVKRATTETQDTIRKIKGQLPAGYGSKSNEWIIYSRLDELKNSLSPAVMTVGTLEEKDGALTLSFSYNPGHSDYNRLINQIGTIESYVFPFISINGLKIGGTGNETPQAGSINVEGAIIIPAGTGGGANP